MGQYPGVYGIFFRFFLVFGSKSIYFYGLKFIEIGFLGFYGDILDIFFNILLIFELSILELVIKNNSQAKMPKILGK